MKTKLTNQFFQDLNLKVSERASCYAGYPKKSLVVIECIRDFSEIKNEDYILNNSSSFVKTIHYGLIGLSTSHLMSCNWINKDIRFN